MLPQLRFKAFSDEWVIYPLKKLSSKPISYGIVQTGHAVAGGVPCVRVVDLTKDKINIKELITTTTEISQSYKKTILSKGEIMVALRGEIGLVAMVPEVLEGANLTRGIARISSDIDMVAPHFLLWALRSPRSRTEFLRQVNGSALKEIPIGGLNKVAVPVAPLAEQQKIADFLTSVDTRIQQLKQKRSLLQQYKKGLMQQLFSQALRFKDDVGHSFPDWQVKSVSELLETVSTRPHQIKSNEILVQGKFPVVDQGKSLVAGYSEDGDKVLRHVPVIVFGDHTAIVKYVEFPFVVGADGTKLLTPKNVKDNPLYLYYNLCHNNVEPEGYKRHFSILKNVALQVPCPEEQTKIANALAAMDKKIDAVGQQIEQTQTFKKGLLQQMFV